MVILGLSDGAEPGAALMSGDRLVSVEPHGRAPGSTGISWSLVREQLARADVAPGDVEMLAIAGRFTPPLVVRQRPWMQGHWDPFGAGASTAVRAERVLRRTGLGAAEADRASEWFEAQARENGFSPRRVVVVDVHHALASAAYRTQPADTVLVLAVMPRGDGAFAAVHVGRAGRLDRLQLESHRTAVHLWLDRCRATLGLDEDELFRAGGEPDPQLAAALARSFRFDGSAFVADHTSRHAAPFSDLAAVDRWIGASTVLAVFRRAMLEWVEIHHRSHPGARKLPQVALGGLLARDPRLVAAVAELPGVKAVWAGPWTGAGALAVGAALATGAPAPQLISPAAEELVPADPDCALADVPELLARGAVVRFDRSAGGRDAWVRADDPQALERGRQQIGLSKYEGIEILAAPGGVRLQKLGALAGPLLHGTSAPLVDDPLLAAVIPADGRIRVRWADPVAVPLLAALRERTGVGAVAVLPIRQRGGVPLAHGARRDGA